MKPEEIFAGALGLVEPWFVSAIDFVAESKDAVKELHIYVDYTPNDGFVADDGKKYRAYDHVDRTWRHMDFFQYRCILHARVPRVRNNAGNTVNVKVPWADVGSSFTLLFEAFAASLAKSGISHTGVGGLMRVDSRRIGRILKRNVDEAVKKEKIEPIENLSIDETSIRKGHKYITVLTDLDRKKVVAVSLGKDGEAVKECLDIMERRGADPKKVKHVSMDLSAAYTSAAQDYLPKAKIVYDRFHLEQLLSKAVDDLRRLEQKESNLLKKTRYLWLRNNDRLTNNQRDRIHYLSATFPRLGQAYQLKEQFKQIYNTLDPNEALETLKEWVRLARKSGIFPILKFVNTLKAHWNGIVSYFRNRISNGFAERVNLKIQEIKRVARGYRNTDNYIDMIYFHCGGLKLPTHF